MGADWTEAELGVVSELLLDQLVVVSLLGSELLVGADLDHLALSHYEDPVCVDDCREAMGDHDDCGLVCVVGLGEALNGTLDHPFAV